MTEPYRPIVERSLVDEGQYVELEISNSEVVQLIKEFDLAINDAIASVHFAILGLHQLRKQVEAIRKLSGKKDPGINLTSSDESVGFFARWTASEILE